MACCQNHRTRVLTSIGSHHSHHLAVAIHKQSGDTRLEMYLTATAQDLVADIGNDSRQAVGADVRMSGIENTRLRTKLTESLQYALRIATLLASREELAIAESTCTTLSETEVRLRIDFLLTSDQSHIAPAVCHVLASFEHYWLDAKFNQFQGGEQATRTQAHHHRLTIALHLAIFLRGKQLHRRILIDIDIHVKLYHDLTLTGIDASVYGAYATDSLWRNGILLSNLLL